MPTHALEYEAIQSDIVREGFDVSAWRRELDVIVRVRPHDASSEHPQPALPSPPRIVVWGDRHGMIHGRIRPVRWWHRLQARIRGQAVQSTDEQIEALTDELIAELDSRGDVAQPVDVGTAS